MRTQKITQIQVEKNKHECCLVSFNIQGSASKTFVTVVSFMAAKFHAKKLLLVLLFPFFSSSFPIYTPSIPVAVSVAVRDVSATFIL